MARQITLTIPDPIYQKAEQVAQIQNRLVTDILSESIQWTFPLDIATNSTFTSTHTGLYQARSNNQTSDETADALAAVERLTNLFSDVTIDGLEQILDDPMMELANYALLKSDQ